jgi:hypothetical protein
MYRAGIIPESELLSGNQHEGKVYVDFWLARGIWRNW